MAIGRSYWQQQQGCYGSVVINRLKPGIWRVKRTREMSKLLMMTTLKRKMEKYNEIRTTN